LDRPLDSTRYFMGLRSPFSAPLKPRGYEKPKFPGLLGWGTVLGQAPGPMVFPREWKGSGTVAFAAPKVCGYHERRKLSPDDGPNRFSDKLLSACGKGSWGVPRLPFLLAGEEP